MYSQIKGTGVIVVQKFFITDGLKVSIICDYLDTITPQDAASNPRLWRKICGSPGNHSYGQNIGHNKTSDWGKLMAKHLNIAAWNTYTGHCFRRTGATQCADNGATTIQLMRRGNWKSPTVAEGYVADTNTGNMTIAGMLELQPATDPDAGHASNKKRSSSPTST
jgi:hypothetical protein